MIEHPFTDVHLQEVNEFGSMGNVKVNEIQGGDLCSTGVQASDEGNLSAEEWSK